MAKPKLKRVTRKRREKKLVERGAAHIRSSFNNQQEVHALRRPVRR